MEPYQQKELFEHLEAEWSLRHRMALMASQDTASELQCRDAVRQAWALSSDVSAPLPKVNGALTYITHTVYQDIVLYNASKTYFMTESAEPLQLSSHGGFTLLSFRLLFSAIHEKQCDTIGIDAHCPSLPKLNLTPMLSGTVHAHALTSRGRRSLNDYLACHTNTLMLVGSLLKQL